MRKALGLLAWTTVTAAGIWSVLPGGTTRPVSADQPLSGDRSNLSNQVADSRGSSLGRINPFTRSSKNSDKDQATYRKAAEKMLDEAQSLAARGDVASARKLAERANSFPVDWAPNERSPERFIEQLDAGASRRITTPTPKSVESAVAQRSTSPAKRVEQVSGTQRSNAKNLEEMLTNSAAPKTASSKLPATQSAKPTIVDEVEELPSPEDEPLPATKKVIPANVEEVESPFGESATEASEEMPEKTIEAVDADEEPLPQATPLVAKPPVAQPTRLPTSADAAKAKSLLQKARADIAKGDFEAARAKADEARGLNVAYKVFDERPEQVLAAIDRAEKNSRTIATNKKPATKSLATASPIEEPSFEADEPALVKKPTVVAKSVPPTIDAESPFDEPSNDEPANPAEIPPAQTDKQLAQQLLSQAQAAAAKGELERARALALQAQELDVVYSLLDVRPEHVIAQIDRATNNLTIAKNAAKTKAKTASKTILDSAEGAVSPFSSLAQQSKSAASKSVETAKSKTLEVAEDVASEATAVTNKAAQAAAAAESTKQKATAQAKQQALAALQDARSAMQAGQLEAARQKALTAQKLNSTFGLWDDRPEALLEEIDRLAQAEADEPAATPAAGAEKAKALALLKSARADLAAGNLESATQKAEQVHEMNVTFDVFDDRPELILSAVKRASRTPAGGSSSVNDPTTPAKAQASTKPAPKTLEAAIASSKPAPIPSKSAKEVELAPPAEEPEELNTAAVHPEGPSAEQLFREGQIHLQTGNKAAAYQAFVRCYQSGQRLDARRSQQLQDYLRELNPRRSAKPIQLASNQTGDEPTDPSSEPRELDPQRPIDIASDRQKVQLDRLRNEVLNSIFQADRLREKDPAKALSILDQTMSNVEGSPLDKTATANLLATLRRTRAEIEGSQKLREPILAQQKQNDDVKQSIKRDRETKIRVEREFANLVTEFNTLIDQRRYAEAEVIAKQAKDLDPENPVAETLVFKSVLARRVASNDKLRNDKESAVWSTLNEVELAAIPYGDESNPVKFPKDWTDIKNRRNGRYGTDTRIRTPEEQRIESSLTRQITLNFENAPLKQVIDHVATVADVNVVLDKAGLEDESLSLTTPVSINVQGIQLKNALNLLLQPLNMGYTIKHEVLQITSEQRLQGELVPVTYSVADLVVPIEPGKPSSPFANLNQASPASIAGQMSVGSTGGPQGGQFQVAGANNAGGSSPWLASSGPAWQVSNTNRGHDFRELIDLITTTCEPNSWAELAGGGQIKGNEATLSLVIRQTQKVHEEIKDLLEQLRRLQDLQVTIEVRFISVSDRFFERIGIDFDFDIQDSLGGPNLFSGGGQGQQGQGGQGGQQQQQGGLVPIPPFGSILSGTQNQQGQQQQGQGQQGQQQQGQGGGNFFSQQPNREFTDRDSYQKGGVILGMGSPQSFTEDNDIAFRQGSFGIGVPDFGRFDANAGLNVGFAILSDIETFFFINAAQGDRRSNIMSAPKVTLYNGQNANVFDGQQRPFVTSLIPVVGAFAVGYQPQLTVVPDGVGMDVNAVISADRRFVRLSVTPFIQQIVDIVAFTFVSAGGGAGQQGQGGGGGGFGGGGGGFGGGGGGQQGFGGIGGGPVLESAGMFNNGVFGRAMGAREDGVDSGALGFGGIQGFGGGGGQGGGGQGGFGGGGGGGGQQGFQAAGAGEVSVQLPVIAQTTVGTSVTVPDGGTVLLGGVKRLRESRNMAGVPILNKIPYISRLFKNTGVGRETDSLMLMVTPRIVILEEEEALLGIPN